MLHLKRIVLSLTILISAASISYAQQTRVGCMDKDIRVQVEQIKHDFKAQNMEVYKDAMLSMTPKEPSAIGVQLNKGQLYQFIYVCSKSATKAYFELYDGSQKKIGDKTIASPGDKNYLIYSFIPATTDVYLIVLNQKTKGTSFLKGGSNEVCGGFSIMQQSASE